MMLKLQMYDVDVKYQKGTEMHIADLLSRAHLKEGEEEKLEYVNAVKHLRIGKEKKEMIKEAVRTERAMVMLQEMIIKGWPKDKQEMPEEIAVYFKHRDELAVEEGLIFRGDRLIIPRGIRKEIKEALHGAHTGIEGSLRRARECVYWPGMTKDMREFVSACEICSAEGRAQTKETLMSHEITSRPWEKVGIDLFELGKQHFLITVDYFSNFWEVDRLERMTTREVIRRLKYHFARYGIPSTVVSDNGTQFTSEEFEKFAKEWDFETRRSSPGHQQANGMAESAVKTAKQLIRKAIDSDRDPFLAILEYRNIPSQDYEASPAQRMLGRRTRTLIPTAEKLLRPERIQTEKGMNIKKMRNRRSAHYYNRNAKDLKDLEVGDTVRIKPLVPGKRKWSEGQVIRKRHERSYDVETENGMLTRNRVHLRKRPTSKIEQSNEEISYQTGQGEVENIQRNEPYNANIQEKRPHNAEKRPYNTRAQNKRPQSIDREIPHNAKRHTRRKESLPEGLQRPYNANTQEKIPFNEKRHTRRSEPIPEVQKRQRKVPVWMKDYTAK